MEDCPVCDGTGLLFSKVCPLCDGVADEDANLALPSPVLGNVIFLDVDGVLNTSNLRSSDEDALCLEGAPAPLCRMRLQLLARIVNRFKCSVVVSSRWRCEHEAYCALIHALSEAGVEVLGRTKEMQRRKRSDEILLWLQEHGPAENWIAIDDIDLQSEQPNAMDGHFVHTSMKDGLTEKHAQAISELLQPCRRVNYDREEVAAVASSHHPIWLRDNGLNHALSPLLRLQFVSDLHTEFLAPKYKCFHMSKILPKPVAPAIALLGDIGYPFEAGYAQVIAYCAANWERVFVVLGNHEYYQGHAKRTMPEIEAQASRICEQYSNVTCAVGCIQIEYNGVQLLLATLWSDLGATAEERSFALLMNDYKSIFVNCGQNAGTGKIRRRLVTPADLQKVHEDTRDWLTQELREYDELQMPTVVLTHHAPTFLLAEGSSMTRAYASDLEHLMLPKTVAWLSGHTHNCSALRVPNASQWGTLCASNCRGYPEKNKCSSEAPVLEYNDRLVLEVFADSAWLSTE